MPSLQSKEALLVALVASLRDLLAHQYDLYQYPFRFLRKYCTNANLNWNANNEFKMWSLLYVNSRYLLTWSFDTWV